MVTIYYLSLMRNSFHVGLIRFGLSCDPSVTSSSAVSAGTRNSVRGTRSTVVTTALLAFPLSHTSRTGIGIIPLVLSDTTNLRGMAHSNSCTMYELFYHIEHMYIMLFYGLLSLCNIFAAMPQPNLDDQYHCHTCDNQL